ncbi:MAG: DNA recombination protein RmuC [Actinomycetota bacterium]
MLGIVAVAGVLIGALLVWVVLNSRVSALRQSEAIAVEAKKSADATIADLRIALETARQDSAAIVEGIKDSVSSVTMTSVQEALARQSDTEARLNQSRTDTFQAQLDPMVALVKEYGQKVQEFTTQQKEALSEVKSATENLTLTQARSIEETARLNLILGRSQQRGEWGEFQLEQLFEQAGLQKNVHYTTQLTGTNSDDKRQRPDFVVSLPNRVSMAVDAKFPYKAFEEAMQVEDLAKRKEMMKAHAKALRDHIKTLTNKAYWNAIEPSPEAVVLFLPSDYMLGAAIEVDPNIVRDAIESHVLLAGPTNVMSLLLSVAMLTRQSEIAVNAEAIREVAEQLYDRILNMAKPLHEMGRSIVKTSQEYNKLLGSMEDRLIPFARSVRDKVGIAKSKELPQLKPVDQLPRTFNDGKWDTIEEGDETFDSGSIIEAELAEDSED